MKKFVLRILIVFIMCIIFFKIYHLVYINTIVAKDENKMAEGGKFYFIPKNIQVANVGSSHGEYDLIYDDIEGYTCFNMAMTGQTVEYDERILEQYIGHMGKNSVLIIPVSYMSFLMDEKSFDREYFESKNKRYAHILRYSNIIDMSFTNYCKMRYLSFFYENDKSEMEHLLDDVLFGQVMEQVSIGDRTADMINIIQDSEDAYQRHVLNYKEGDNYLFKDDLKTSVINMVNMCKKRGITPVFITTPYLQEYLDQAEDEFLVQFYELIDNICKEAGVDYYDYSRDARFSARYDLFMDSDHLNTAGGKMFTKILFDECLSQYLNK